MRAFSRVLFLTAFAIVLYSSTASAQRQSQTFCAGP